MLDAGEGHQRVRSPVTGLPSGERSSSDTDVSAFRAALFNGAVEPDALGMVACADADAVRDIIVYALKERLPIAVVGGGHDMSGRAFVQGNVVLDLRGLKQIAYDADSHQITIGSGVIASELLAALPPERAVIVGGCLSVGIVGFTMGGGYGALTPRFGLGCDALVSARMVLADGSAVSVSASENADLFWALRGGGSGFGVVTSMTIATHDQPHVLTSGIVIPLDGAKHALQVVQTAIDDEPVDLSVFTAFITGPGGEPVLFASLLWTGDKPQGDVLIDRLLLETGAMEIKRD